MIITEIDLDSPAGQELRSLLSEPHGYVIRISAESETSVKLKLNGGMWSPPMSTRATKTLSRA